MRYVAVTVSCTPPMRHAAASGETAHTDVSMRFRASRAALVVVGKCTQISSPSKSALYGCVADTGIRMV